MSLWRLPRYYCTNTAASCRYAVRDVPFTTKNLREYQGRCRGYDADGCGEPLVEGDPRDLRLRWAIIILAFVTTVALGRGLYSLFHPSPLEHVAFAASKTVTDDGSSLLQLEVVRDSDLGHRMQVEYASADGTARAGQDYEAVRSQLIFEPGERRKSLPVLLLPDRTLQKGARYFTLTLLNVTGAPRHIVQIEPRAADRTQEMQAEQTVLSASQTAADIGTLRVKRGVLRALLTAHTGTQAQEHTYQRELDGVDDNLNRAREGYMQLLTTLQTYQPPLVLQAMDHVHEDLEHRNFAQQARALALMKSQFAELIEKKHMDMDRWVEQLESIVPHLDPAAAHSRTST